MIEYYNENCMAGMANKVKLFHGDCLIESDNIESGSVDLILTDPPYGTVLNIGDSDTIEHGMKGRTKWDEAIDPRKICEIANRILRKNGKMILFSQEPYTGRLINEAIPNVPFNYRMIWAKDHFANSLISKKSPVSYYEDILVFSKLYDHNALHPLRPYFKQIREHIKAATKEINNTLGNVMSSHYFTNGAQFSIPVERDYNKLIQAYRIDNMEGFKTYEELRVIDKKYDSTFNLWEGKKHKSNILTYRKDYDGYHPTQKPVLLLEDLIKTFSNEGNLVVDLTMGSGSTAVACINANRNFIGIEKDGKYFEIAKQRLEDFMAQPRLEEACKKRI